nr:hypothetical protein CFP56_20368 [Quercus suber]
MERSTVDKFLRLGVLPREEQCRAPHCHSGYRRCVLRHTIVASSRFLSRKASALLDVTTLSCSSDPYLRSRRTISDYVTWPRCVASAMPTGNPFENSARIAFIAIHMNSEELFSLEEILVQLHVTCARFTCLIAQQKYYRDRSSRKLVYAIARDAKHVDLAAASILICRSISSSRLSLRVITAVLADVLTGSVGFSQSPGLSRHRAAISPDHARWVCFEGLS